MSYVLLFPGWLLSSHHSAYAEKSSIFVTSRLVLKDGASAILNTSKRRMFAEPPLSAAAMTGGYCDNTTKGEFLGQCAQTPAGCISIADHRCRLRTSTPLTDIPHAPADLQRVAPSYPRSPHRSLSGTLVGFCPVACHRVAPVGTPSTCVTPIHPSKKETSNYDEHGSGCAGRG